MNVFAYGSLMFDEVWLGVVGRMVPSVTASLENFEAWKIAGEPFPGMAPASGHRVTGRVWSGISQIELDRLDAFESGIYDRQPVFVRTAVDPSLQCWAYVVQPGFQTLLLPEPWDRDEFRRLHLATFLD